VQKHTDFDRMVTITPDSDIIASRHGGRAKCLQRLIRLALPVPKSVALSFAEVRDIAAGNEPNLGPLVAEFPAHNLLIVRPSSEDADWGGPGAIPNIGMCDATHAVLVPRLGQAAADALYARFVQTYAVQVARLDPDLFEFGKAPDRQRIDEMLAAYAAEMEETFPSQMAHQLAGVLRSMARSWDGPTARLLRQAKGAPPDAGLGLVVQVMALGIGRPETDECGAGVIQFVSSETGEAQVTGRYLSQSQGREALTAGAGVLFLSHDARGPSLEDICPGIIDELREYGDRCRVHLREEMQIEFTIDGGALAVHDAVRVHRSARAGVQIAVALAEAGVIAHDEAIMRVPTGSLPALLHRQVDPASPRDLVATGIGASPGAATGRLVFSSREAQEAAAREESCILVRRETSPDDVRGMHAAAGVLTVRGGLTSHAAVIARGLGLPCVVGASAIEIDRRASRLTTTGGRQFRAGDLVTIDGSSGEVLAGAATLFEPAPEGALNKVLDWADGYRDIGVRANADMPADARVARTFKAEGIGLCRTEHMFFEPGRLNAMREAIFTDNAEDRAAALDQLLAVQRADFASLFRVMKGKPVCMRLLDPPLHEFLPSGRDGLQDLAQSLDLSLADVTQRVASLAEFNPMLGMRGVRLGITVPEIYDMQARAIFEATAEVGETVPEIMIPLVSAKREVELVRARIDAVAAAVRRETGIDFDYRLGVMVETPRAALRANEIAQAVSFLSFGTNDLTQMTYGLSRDDAGRFMGIYVAQGVFPEDPFLQLDVDGVGELLRIGAARGRETRADITLSVCGEHGGDPDSIAFCRQAGFDYVSCSPFRVPLARLAAAQLAIAEPRDA